LYRRSGWSRIRVRIGIEREGGETIYRGDHLFGYHNGFMVHFGTPKRPAPNPEPGDPDFTLRKIQYVKHRLNDFERVNTAQGAPSDFCLRRLDRKVMFNLMHKGVLQRIADYVYRTFDNDTDRLIGANFLVHTPAFMTYAQTPSFVEDLYNPLSVLRHGTAQCGAFADVLEGIVRKLRMQGSRRCFTTHGLNMHCLDGEGHCIIVVHYRGKHIPLDPSIGRIFFNRDNTALASVEELVADPELVDRQTNMYSKYYPCAQNLSFSSPGRVIWPENAPAE